MTPYLHDTTLCAKVGRWFSPGAPVSSTNKTEPPRYNWNIVESGVKHSYPNNDENDKS